MDDHIGRSDRGRGEQLPEEAHAIARSMLSRDDPGLYWGGTKLPSDIASKHFVVMGNTGSGKTITMRLLMQSALRAVGSKNNPHYRQGHRALVYDAKQEYLPLIAGLRLSCPVVTLHPFDVREGERGITSAAWDMAADITSPLSAQQVASILIPDNPKESQPFFTKTARNLLRGVLIAFLYKYQQEKQKDLHAPPWTFRDVLLAMRSREYMDAVLNSCPFTEDMTEYTSDRRLYDNIRAGILTFLADYEPIAAAWHHAYQAGRYVSLHDWLQGEYVLVLGSHEASRSALDAINRVLFKRLTELILAQPTPTADIPSRTWVFFDEVREAGKLDGLSRLLNQGRSKGACVVLGFQDIEGMREVYGPYVANELIGQCGNKALLRVDSPEMAEWASNLAGTKEAMEEGASVFFGFKRMVQGSVSQYRERKLLLPSELMGFRPTSRQNGLTGYYIVPDLNFPFRYTEQGERLFDKLLEQPDVATSPLCPCPPAHEFLDMTYSDLGRLGFSVPNTSEVLFKPLRRTGLGED